MARPGIFLADGQTMMVDALRNFLQPEFEVVGTAADGRTLVSSAQKFKPDLIIVELDLPLLNGIDACKQIKTRLPQTKFLVLSANEDHLLAVEVLRSWAAGYLLKTSTGSELIQAIRDVLTGKIYAPHEVKFHLQCKFISKPARTSRCILTPRQREILQLLAEGWSAKQAAYILGVSERTVCFHKYRIKKANDLENNFDLVKLAMQENLVFGMAKATGANARLTA
jgi:DNA-binding NarL/FixJ family response regulator